MLQKFVPESYPRAALQSPKAGPKSIPENNLPKLLLKVATKNCSPQFLVNKSPKADIFQNNFSSKLLRKVIQNQSKLLPATPQNCYPKLVPQRYYFSNLYPKTIPQGYSAGGSRKLRPKTAIKYYFPKLFVK